ncbi:MAG: hypothetical protein ACRERD_23175 [Candidatus Binatia bacterium]
MPWPLGVAWDETTLMLLTDAQYMGSPHCRQRSMWDVAEVAIDTYNTHP